MQRPKWTLQSVLPPPFFLIINWWFTSVAPPLFHGGIYSSLHLNRGLLNEFYDSLWIFFSLSLHWYSTYYIRVYYIISYASRDLYRMFAFCIDICICIPVFSYDQLNIFSIDFAIDISGTHKKTVLLTFSCRALLIIATYNLTLGLQFTVLM
jgi:hypothetical protein